MSQDENNPDNFVNKACHKFVTVENEESILK